MSIPVRMTPPMCVTEKEWQRSIETTAEMWGWLVFHDNDSRRNKRGLPDLIAVRGSVVLFAELKIGDAPLRPEQKTWLARLREAEAQADGGVVVKEWRFPDSWDDVIRTLMPAGWRLDGDLLWSPAALKDRGMDAA